jgi:hypothetical protein
VASFLAASISTPALQDGVIRRSLRPDGSVTDAGQQPEPDPSVQRMTTEDSDIDSGGTAMFTAGKPPEYWWVDIRRLKARRLASPNAGGGGAEGRGA